MNSVQRLAAKDASRSAYATMFFGEGAGTRRKLLNAEIIQKKTQIPGYAEAFEKAYAKQDMGAHAVKAAAERRRIDRNAYFKRNTRGLITGNRATLTTGVAIATSAWVFAHQTGLDVPIKAEVKKQYGKAKDWVRKQRDKRHTRKFNLYTNH